MSGILDLLNSDLGKQIIGGVSQETNQPADKTASVVSMALPLLMGAMKRNANSQDGAAGLMGALDNKHDGSILDNLGGFFGGGVNESAKQDGLGILGHVLGGSQNNVVSALSNKSGMDTDSVMRILTVIAPIVLGYLGKEKRQKNVSDQSGIGGLLGGLLGGGEQEAPKQQSLIESILDGDNDGSVIDDVAGMVLGGKKGGGGLLGGLFGN
ncbi:MAG TPA: DUF937 domain-containing protein [Flavobacteriaceae bacterium]|jgi:hypothetical protein|nr:hypothetical protein [Flavobacteriaceae bacterium]MAM27497.1 hypothetical protein [Flavobacteriaceae bacterium]HBR54096.1 hypothetical protein [Flavobacteriaceae bacterium]HIB48042.1 DUF937 domain-containing protein [Flavobacteriaceae bacterium]HIN98689.1 DUF937 domain-containing protein [Flavobacteriaceae bacterium]|tara:strand:- start:1315 stop:1947 length:633 start_codon:yes stop_codon:yes gene_type:complete